MALDPEETPSLRDSLSTAFDEGAEPIEAIAEPVAVAPEPQDGETQEQADERARDEAGRFAKTKPAVVVKPTAVKPSVRPAAVVPTTAKAVLPGKPSPSSAQPPIEMKAPQSWRGPAKETWGALPEAARVEVLRREKEITQQLTAAGEDRKYAASIRATMQPYEAQIRAEGSTPEAAIGKLLNTAMALRTSPPAHKAQLVASLIQDFGVPLQHLVNALSGQQMPTEQPQQQQQFDPAAVAQQVEASLMKRLGASRESALVSKYTAETESFLEGRAMHGLDGNDYGEQIQNTMADLIETAARRGSTITLEQAYSLAARSHPEVSKVLAQQERAAGATKAQASTQRARAAAVSVRSTPATQPVSRNDGNSLRESLEAAAEAHS